MSALDVFIGGMELLAALVVALSCWRRRRVRWLTVFALFIALRGLDRLILGVLSADTPALGLGLDFALACVLMVIVLTARTVLTEIERTQAAAELRALEYDRALTDYRRMARHRLATPLTAILGSARALRDMPDLDARTRDELVETILKEGKRLEQVVVDPHAPLASEESGLRPTPELRAGRDH
jgi:signal transduction histidine kinase